MVPEEDYQGAHTALKVLSELDVVYDLPHALALGPNRKTGSIPEWGLGLRTDTADPLIRPRSIRS